MILSKYTFTVPKISSDDLIIANYLSSSIDIIEAKEKQEYLDCLEKNNWENYKNKSYMLERGYLIQSKEQEEELLQDRFMEFSEENEKNPVQIIFAPSYACNFSCTYCYQEEYNKDKAVLTNDVSDKFFSYINRKFAGEIVKPYITLFGGEPLLPGKEYQKALGYFLEKAAQYDYEICVVTNGYELSNYIPLFQKAKIKIKEVQVTLDGDKKAHDSRRFTHSGASTFDVIVKGIEDALAMSYPINMRNIIDKDNIDSLPILAEFTKTRGWLVNENFQTSFGRNYELYTCQNTEKLFDRVSMWQEYVKLAEQYPVLKEYHKPYFHGMKYLNDTGELPLPVFDTCPAGTKEWAFDAKGGIYSCTASVGVEKFQLGNYLEEEEKPEAEQIKQMEEMQNRDILEIPECQDCAVAPACGGGCAVLAYNKSKTFLAADCRPVKELLALGIEFYNIDN